ncbi:dTDP-4-dehydrorhamnose reductase family protein [Hydrogenovibrio marinus]|uniref:dTDP-4-dehydrorhamnose reductase n=1 Tax=Hydrogenovibrio marinus TaxID=28885 RepID=A0A067A339_HYDMR|nr:SDR family oxidoreductase [Hydrogenovibrio marinus]KDN96755.1 dTDP-4-dehydrorhamnose reductase [Hydrogenovibrio marinus]BBN59005.1 NAD(P)-dependent oxidoreductase [Hydrogenovibrio marinus]
MRVLVIGASGMIGSTIFRVLSEDDSLSVYGAVRNADSRQCFNAEARERIISSGDLLFDNNLIRLIEHTSPDAIINCAGVTKHLPESSDPLISIPMNAVFPHKLESMCNVASARLVHISTDCVFSGRAGNYTEEDVTDSVDLYGRSKALGEVVGKNSVTLRTSTIGHEFSSTYGLLEWFLAQEGLCYGYAKAYFSGLPTVVFAEIIRDQVLPNSNLTGLYNVAAKRISKFDLLNMIADVYKKTIEIIPNNEFSIDRSLDAGKFLRDTGYSAPEWQDMIDTMYKFK